MHQQQGIIITAVRRHGGGGGDHTGQCSVQPLPASQSLTAPKSEAEEGRHTSSVLLLTDTEASPQNKNGLLKQSVRRQGKHNMAEASVSSSAFTSLFFFFFFLGESLLNYTEPTNFPSQLTNILHAAKKRWYLTSGISKWAAYRTIATTKHREMDIFFSQ